MQQDRQMISDLMLNELEKSRQKDSDWYVSKIDLIPKLLKYGRVQIVGAKALGLMIAKDIDISVVVDSLNVKDWQDLVRELMVTPHVRNISAIDYYNYDEHNRYDPKNGQKYSLYISINNILGPENDKYDTWECQIHLIDSKMFDETKITYIKNKLTDEKRVSILRLKYWSDYVNKILKSTTNGNYKIYSPSIYDAVLNNNVSSIDQLVEFLESSVPNQFKEDFSVAVAKANKHVNI